MTWRFTGFHGDGPEGQRDEGRRHGHVDELRSDAAVHDPDRHAGPHRGWPAFVTSESLFLPVAILTGNPPAITASRAM